MSEHSLTGHTLGPYAVGQLIGQGGCARVYRARRTAGAANASADVALKVFDPELVTDERTFQRFEREAELGRRLRHPHIVPTYDWGAAEHAGTLLHYMAMELVDGETLRDVLTELRIVPEDLLYQIADQVLDALAAVHAEGMIHRDVKPENIILTRDQQVRVMDLGVARLQQEGRDLTLDGEFVGSLAYASPEQFTDQDHVDPRTDIYAVGVLLYEMATGVNPYDEGDLRTLIDKKLRLQIRRPRIVNRDVEPFLDDVIRTCLERKPEDRFASCDALRRVLAERETSAWWLARIEGDAFPAATRAMRRLRPPRDAPLVGRALELEGLHAAYDDVKTGTGGVAFVVGPAGIGKSRLVHDFLEDLVAPDGPVLLAGRCPEEAARAHHPFLEAMDGFRGGGTGRSPLEGAADFLTFVRERAAERPVVLVIEDVQRADPDSIVLLEQLTRACADLCVLLVATWRPEDVEEGSPLYAWATVTAASAATQRFALPPLDDEGVEALLSALLGTPRTVRALGFPLARASSGNPHFLLEIVEHLRAAGDLVRDGDAWRTARPIRDVAVPESMRILLLLRLVDVEADLMQLLEAAAAQGPEFDASLLAAVTGQKRLHLLKRLAVLERRHGILNSAGRGAFRFASHGLWQVIYEAMRADRRREVHAACADALRSGDAPLTGASAYAWVDHMLAADRASQALDAVPAAAAYAASQVHAVRGIRFLERLAAALGTKPGAPCLEVHLGRAKLQALLGHPEEARRALADAEHAAQAEGGAHARGRVANAVAAASLRDGDLARAQDVAEEALRLAEASGDDEARARALHTLGTVALRTGAFERGAQHLRAALPLWQEVGAAREEAATALQLGRVLPEIGARNDARAMRELALARFRDVGERRGEAAALDSIGNAWVDEGQLDKARTCYEDALTIVRALGDLPAEAATRHNLARLCVMESRIEDGRAMLAGALDIYRQLGDVGGEAAALDALGAALGAFGDHDAALRALQEAQEVAERAGDAATLTQALRHLACLRHESGDTAGAWADFERAQAIAPRSARSALLADMGSAALRQGEPGRAVALLEEALGCASSLTRRLVGLCRLARAQHEAGDTSAARARAEEAAALIDATDGSLPPNYGPEIYYSLATVLQDEDRGVDYLVKANALIGARVRAIQTVVYREHYLTTRWPNREILMEVRKRQA